MQSVGDWLEGIGLPQYENTFIANGYDDMEFMVSVTVSVSVKVCGADADFSLI